MKWITTVGYFGVDVVRPNAARRVITTIKISAEIVNASCINGKGIYLACVEPDSIQLLPHQSDRLCCVHTFDEGFWPRAIIYDARNDQFVIGGGEGLKQKSDISLYLMQSYLTDARALIIT